MENWVSKSDPSVSVSSSESIGDSETDLATDTNTVISDAFVPNITNSDVYDDDAESTSGDNGCATTDENVRHDHTRTQMLCKNWWYDLYDTKQRVLDDHGEIIEEQRNRDNSAVLVAEKEAVAAARDDAESNRLFWDACIAHGY